MRVGMCDPHSAGTWEKTELKKTKTCSFGGQTVKKKSKVCTCVGFQTVY